MGTTSKDAAKRTVTLRIVRETEPGYDPTRDPRITDAGGIARVVAPLLAAEAVEVFVGIYLDTRHRVLGTIELGRGTLNACLVHPREVFRPALLLPCAAIAVAHNHPSGDAEPSREDIALTKRLRAAGDLLGVPLLDHLVLGDRGAFVSLAERGQL